MALDQSSSANPRERLVFFDRRELERLLRLHSRMVAAGEWRDYAVDGFAEVALFQVFRRAHDAPLYSIEKRPALAKRQGAYAVIGAGGQVLRRGRELEQVLLFFDKGRLALVK